MGKSLGARFLSPTVYIAVTRLVLCLELQVVSLHRFSGSRSQMKQFSKMTVYYLMVKFNTVACMT